MTIKKLSFTKAQLQAVPEHDRMRLVELMIIQDELSTLSVAATLSTPKGIGANEDIDAVQWGQMWFYVRLLAGKLHEAWLWLGQVVLSSPDSLVVQSALPHESQQTLNSLKATFGQRGNVFAALRNQTAFHFDSTRVREAYEVLPVDTSFVVWATPRFGTTRYNATDVIYRQMASRMMSQTPHIEAAVELSSLICDTAKSFVAFLNDWFAALMVHISMDGETTEVEDVRVEYLPALFDLEAWAERAGLLRSPPELPTT